MINQSDSQKPFQLKSLDVVFLFFFSGCKAEVPFSAGGGHGEAGWTGEEDRETSGGIEAVLGGPQIGQTGESFKTVAMFL